MELFLSSIRSTETRDKYSIYFKKYQEFVGHDLFCGNNPRLIEQKIIEFLIDMRNKGKGYSTIHNYAAAVLAFYKINDLVLNVTKISKFIPVQKKVKKDRAYTHEEIGKLLEITDERVRAMILLLASSGIRVGALPLLRLRNLEGTKLTVYENEREEYFTFITPECQKAIDTYLDMRSRYGEKLDKESERNGLDKYIEPRLEIDPNTIIAQKENRTKTSKSNSNRNIKCCICNKIGTLRPRLRNGKLVYYFAHQKINGKEVRHHISILNNDHMSYCNKLDMKQKGRAV